MSADPSDMLQHLSQWIDEANGLKSAGMQVYERTIVKLAEEVGEVGNALIGIYGQNPRKGFYSGREQLVKELLDVALTALGAVEHLHSNCGMALQHLNDHIATVHERAFDADR